MPSATEPHTGVPAAPRRVGRWRLQLRLGAGAFGTVWRAEDDGGQVAVVKLLSEPPGQELRALTRVVHPAVVRCLGAGTVPVPHLVMSLAPGAPLSDVMAGNGLDDASCHPLIAALSDALAACHRANIPHGDIKPANVIVDPGTGRVSLVDFGLSGSRGGTPEYAAPEVLAGSPGGLAADVYSLGLLAWALGHGALPHADVPWTEGASRRSRDAPEPTEGPVWWRELVVSMLAPDPRARPTAASVADAYSAQGFAPPKPTLLDLAQRGVHLAVPRPAVDRAVDTWLDGGSSLGLVGPSGSGRSHALRRAGHELRARGLPFVMISPSRRPWAAIEAALDDPGLSGPPMSLPDGADPILRAEAAARALRDRAGGTLRILVDDLESLDEGSRRTLRAAEQSGARILAASTGPTSWLPQHVSLEPLGLAQAETLVAEFLGDVDAPLVARMARTAVGGWPAHLANYVLAAVRDDALVFRRGQWVVDRPRLEHLDPQDLGPPVMLAPDLPAASRRLAAVVGLMEPVDADEALAIADVGPDALGSLRDSGLVRGRRVLRSADPRSAAALRGAVDDLRPLWHGIVRALQARDPVPMGMLGWALHGAGDVEGIGSLGVACVRAAMERDVLDAAELATGLLAQCPSAELAAARIDAWVQAGHVQAAREAGQSWLAGRDAGPSDLPTMIALAQLEDAVSEDADAILTWTRRAREALANAPGPPALDLVEARGRFRAGDHADAEAICVALCPEPPDPENPAGWLAARGLLAQIRAQRISAAAGVETMRVVTGDFAQGSRARALYEGIRGRLLWMAGRPREGAVVMETAATHRQALSTVDRARLENNAALCWYAAGDVERAVAGWERALLAFELLGSNLEIARVQVNLCQGFSDLGRWARAVQAGELAVQLARVHQVPHFEAVARGNLGDVALWRRRFAEASRHYDSAEGLAEAHGLEDQRVELARRRAELAAWKLDLDAMARAEHAESVAREAGAELDVARSQAVRALLLARSGAGDLARSNAHHALATLRAHGATGELSIARLWVAEAWLVLRDPDGARQLATEVKRYAEEFGRAPLRAWADDLLTWSTPGTRDEHRRLERLTELDVRVASRSELADVLDELASAAVELIDAERAFVVLAEGDRLTIAASAGDRPQDAQPSMSVVRRALALGRDVVVTDIEERADLRHAESVVSMDLKAVLCVPLLDQGAVAGALYLDSREQPISALGDSVALIRSLAAHASVALSNARLTAQVQRQVRRAREVAHDLRNPLWGVLMVLEDAAEGDGTVGCDEARLAIDGLRHALDLVASTLSTDARVPVTFPWDTAVGLWARSLDPQARAGGVTLHVDTTVSGSVTGHPTELRRVLGNLVTNAVKYTSSGGTVTVRTLAEGHRVGLQVEDEGPGIPDTVRERVFEAGVQGPQAAPGHGLGLSIARRICREHGGDVTADNSPMGARFTVWLPRAAPSG